MHRREIEMISGIVTSILLILFLGSWRWAWSPKRHHEFEVAAQIPLEELPIITKEGQR